MRHERPDSEDAETIASTAYTFHFQISNNGGRRACSVEVRAPNIGDATIFFRENWPMIESMARGGLAAPAGDDRTIRLAMPGH
jgi:hypothetical protein